ncbi:glycosyltransferase family 2 protein [Massilia sp. CF038]|uniref:glycosyltransferase family 2 protein n=1 Tax=Massilia sp. CF038 TaxID=1881045 RepID=UPI000917EF0B|nr:glycosyltransferase family 2 protein [Massilia sp. CF038]SHG68285.1 Glycosyltransferase involved in cell wall bisynthesis [Massilia sp. CF038]
MKTCVLIPVYDHEHAIGDVVRAVLAQNLHCILVDDGSSAGCARVLDTLAQTAPGAVTLVRHAHNQGKGGAVISGFRRAAQDGFSHVLQIDADGQHNVADIPLFLALAQRHPDALIVGSPIYDESVPKVRLYARYLTHVWVWINTLSFAIQDSMCGFRVYPVAPAMALINRRQLGLRMNFDTDILVRLHWDGVQVINQPTRVRYPTDGVSHFRGVLDNVLISRMHATLFLGMLVRLPLLLARKWRTR